MDCAAILQDPHFCLFLDCAAFKSFKFCLSVANFENCLKLLKKVFQVLDMSRPLFFIVIIGPPTKISAQGPHIPKSAPDNKSEKSPIDRA